MRKFPAVTMPFCGQTEGKPSGPSWMTWPRCWAPGVLCVEPAAEDVIPALKKRDAVFVRGVGAIVQAADPDDREALCLLTEKSALCALHTAGLGIKAHLSALDAALMHLIYQKKYAKRKG